MRGRLTEAGARDGRDFLATLPGDLHQPIHAAARSMLPVLILGETGTGKTYLARWVHALGPRARKPFVHINCAELTRSLIEAQLFGHERGAYTGADRSRPGLIEAAHGGTLFLDEIAELPRSLQAKLLSLLDGGAVRRVGSITPLPVDARVICATNRNLEELVARGAFRRDLYYRCRGLTLHLRPLRNRTREIPLLVRSLLHELAVGTGRPAPDITDAAIAFIRERPWPGNLRQLKYALQFALDGCEGTRIDRHHLPHDAGTGALDPGGTPPTGSGTRSPTHRKPRYVAPPDPREERRRIQEALARHGGNRTRAAAELGMSRQLLYLRLHRYGIA